MGRRAFIHGHVVAQTGCNSFLRLHRRLPIEIVLEEGMHGWSLMNNHSSLDAELVLVDEQGQTRCAQPVKALCKAEPLVCKRSVHKEGVELEVGAF